MNAELVLAIPYAAAEHRAGAEHGTVARERRPLARVQPHPVADELFDPDGHSEKVLKDCAETFGVPHVPHERADVKQLRDIRNRVAVAKRRRRDADERADIHREVVVLRTIAIDVRLRLRPGPVEQRKKAMVEDIEESAERRVAGIAQPFPRVLGDVQRQRPVRTEQPEQSHLQPRRPSRDAGLERGERRRRERQIGILPQPDPLVDRSQRFAPAGLFTVQAFQTPQRLIEIEAVRRRRQLGEEG